VESTSDLARQDVPSRSLAAQLTLVFLASFLFLFLGMSRRPGMYDEGIMLTGAMRVAAGQIPHRDFYFIYGPAEVYLLAGLFKTFGFSLLVERLFDLLVKALTVAAVYGIALTYMRRTIAIFAALAAFLWIYGTIGFAFAMTPVALLNLVSSALILPVFTCRISAKRMAFAGAIAGTASLFRYDTGIALLGIHAISVGLALFLRGDRTTDKLRSFVSIFWPYLAGFAVLTLPPALYYLAVAPVHPILHDIFLFPSKYYHRNRNLPFPVFDWKTLENLGVYTPVAIACAAVYAVVQPPRDQTNTPIERGFLITFGLLLVVMYLKGLVRISPGQVYLALIPSLLVIGMLVHEKRRFALGARVAIDLLVVLALVAPLWASLHLAWSEYRLHFSVAQELLAPDRRAWCYARNSLTRGLCFLPEDDRTQAIEFLNNHTRPGQSLYSAIAHHDRIVANDNLIYFATQQLPATHWSHLDPGLETRSDVQQQMIEDLKRNRPPYIVVDAEFDQVREPNDSANSSGVTLLDDYIRNNYRPVATFGTETVRQRLD
jgi:hypothetical protein